jgi:hypothetical protein
VIGQSEDGSLDSFQTQTYLDSGVALEDLFLRYDGGEGSSTRFTLKAWGFGGAEPTQHARLDLRLDSPWRFRLDYDRRESFFRLQETELGLRSDDWEIERFQGSIEWDGWKAARLALDLRAYERSGNVVRPLFGLNELYPLALDLDESMQEAALRLETKDLPVKILFEQSLASYERDNRRRPADDTNLDGGDPDLFIGAQDTREEQRDIPTSRLIVTWGSPRVEVAGSLLWSSGELDSPGLVSETFAIGGGSIGRTEFIDDAVAAADYDVFSGNLRLGFQLAPKWVLRLEGSVSDRSTDATLLGETLVRITNPLDQVFEIGGFIDESTVFDVEEDQQRLTLEWSDGGWTVWGGGFAASRDVDWRLGSEGESFDETRDSDGALVGVAWSRGRFQGSAEYEHGSFDRFIFRTEPETVDRLTFRLRSELDRGWSLRAHARLEDSDNPREIAGLDRSSDAYGLGLGWDSKDGKSGFGLDLDQVDLTTETDLILPRGTPGLSLYDLSLLTTSLYGRTEMGKARLDGTVTRLDDSGDTWPVESWIAKVRVGFEVAPRTELSVFGEYWSYDEDLADLDDYDVTRYGVAFHWRFE